MKAKTGALRLGLAAAAIVVGFSSCVSAGFINFATSQPMAPGHVSIGIGAEESGVTNFPDPFAMARIGVVRGLDVGVRAGLGTLLADARYRLPFRWKRAALTLGLGGGANFSDKVAQVDAPITFSYRFGRVFTAIGSQTSTLYIGKYSGFALTAGLGMELTLGHFYLMPRVAAGYLSPSGGSWAEPGSNIGQLGSYTILMASRGGFASAGLALGLNF